MVNRGHNEDSNGEADTEVQRDDNGVGVKRRFGNLGRGKELRRNEHSDDEEDPEAQLNDVDVNCVDDLNNYALVRQYHIKGGNPEWRFYYHELDKPRPKTYDKGEPITMSTVYRLFTARVESVS